MIAESSVAALLMWRREAVGRLEQLRKQNDRFKELCEASTSAVRVARYKGEEITWRDREAILELVDALISGGRRMLTARSTELEWLIGKLDELAKDEVGLSLPASSVGH